MYKVYPSRAEDEHPHTSASTIVPGPSGNISGSLGAILDLAQVNGTANRRDYE